MLNVIQLVGQFRNQNRRNPNYECRNKSPINSLIPELNPSAQRCVPRFFVLEILILKGLTARRLYKSLEVKVLTVVEQTDTSNLNYRAHLKKMSHKL
jgi:hypothetical protein